MTVRSRVRSEVAHRLPARGVVAMGLLASALLLGAATAVSGQEADLDEVAFSRGNPDAPVVIVEYADFACSACAEFARDTWPEIERRYVETGVVRWHFIPFELGFRNSEEGARAAQCSETLGSFWAMHDVLFARRSEWEDLRNPGDLLGEIAVEAGLDAPAFLDSYAENPGKARTRAATRAAKDDGIRGTPTFFINGFRVQGALPLDAFVQLIESARSR